MNLYRWLMFIALLVCSIDVTYATDDWTFVKSWIGKYPSASVGDTKGGLLAQPSIKAAMKKILPKSEILSALSTDAPVRELDEFVIVNKCRPHNCPSDMAAVVIDVKNAQLWVGFFSREEDRVSTRWYGTSDDYSVLPESIKKDFLARHGD